jgi:DNA-binding GntR family transcriptional regulator
VAKAGDRAKPESLARLHRIVDRMRAVHDEPDAVLREKKAIALDREFHTELCALAGNDFLNGFHRQLSLHANMTLIHEKTYHSLERGWHEIHAEILECIEKEPARAAEVLHRHFTNVTNLLDKNGGS